MKKIVAIIVFLLIIVGGLIAWNYYDKAKNQPKSPAVCTQEAKLCPDGSYVGRTGPNCEFTACPVITQPQIPADWKTFTDTASGIIFQYPETLGTKYILTQTWPPKITVSNNAFSCVPTASANEPPVTINQKKINGEGYCVSVASEGAAGTIYITYNYSTETNGKLINLNFILRYPECANYPDTQMTECNNERTDFNLDGLIDQIVQSVKIN